MDEQSAIRQYLLGILNDEEKLRQIEEKLLLDDDFAEEISLIEAQLTEDYLDSSLDPTYEKAFLQVFLSSPERRQELRLVRNLRKYAAKSVMRTDKQFSKDRPSATSWRSLLSFPVLRFAALILIVCVVGLGVFRIAFYPSDVDKGLAQLRLAYRGQRPIELRTTGNFDYAPAREVRGEMPAAADEKALREAKSFLFRSNSAKSHQALGVLYLAERNFDTAFKEFNSALESDPKDATIHNDMGALFLEKAKQANVKDGKSYENLTLSLKYIEQALKLDGSLPEALFNRALVLQEMKSTQQAKEAWQKYLDKDSVSPWAGEARKNLDEIESTESQRITPDEVLQDFLTAYREKDEEKAYHAVSSNREMTNGKMVSQHLIFLFLNSSETDKQEYLSALLYLGKLEKEKSKDPFFYEIADFYARASAEDLGLLKDAYGAIKQGYVQCDLEKYAAALEHFTRAYSLFEKAGNKWEAMLTDYWIAYCEHYNGDISESTARLSKITDLCQGKNYKWLCAQAYYRLSVNENSIKETSKSLNYAVLSLKFSEETFDFYNIQKTYSFMAESQISVKQYPEALANMAKVLLVIDAPEYSERQKWRDFDRLAKLFHGMKLYDAAAAYEMEAFILNQNKIKDVSFERVSLAFLSRIYGSQKKYPEAVAFAEKAREAAERLGDEKRRQKGIAYALLQAAALELERGNFQESLANYNKVLAIYSSGEFQLYRYEAEKGRLLCYLAGKNDEAVQRTMPEVMQLFEASREKILDEQNRDTFFDGEQNIYDLAVAYEYDKGNYEKAFDYAESSRSRSLLDWQKNGGKVVLEKGIPKTVFPENTVSQPSLLNDIRAQMPEQAQLVYYTVLPDRILIWLVARDKFETFSYAITDDDLVDKANSFTGAINRLDEPKQIELSHSLYSILFSQVEDRLDPAKDIFLIPDKILFQIPFGALISGKTENYLVADHRISTSPSASNFLESSNNARKRGQAGVEKEKILSIGNPTFDKEEFPGLKPLDAAEKEAKKIAELYFENDTLSDRSATKQNIIEGIAKADVVQFAGHYITNDSSYLLSSFAITGVKEESRWANHEILSEKLERPKLIILSACETGIERYYKGEGMIGAGRTFLALGVPLVVASQWKVDSGPTAELMEKFHRLRKKEGFSTSAALQRAQIEMLSSSDPTYRQPYFWAGFITLGGYAQF